MEALPQRFLAPTIEMHQSLPIGLASIGSAREIRMDDMNREAPTPLPPLAKSAPRSNDEARMTELPMDVDSDEDGDSSDGNWSSGSSFDDDSDGESVFTFDSAESITYVRAKGHTVIHVCEGSYERFERPNGELSWRMDPKENFSDYTLVVRTSDTGKESRYNVHRAILAFGQFRCDYFAKLFRSSFRENQDAISVFILSER